MSERSEDDIRAAFDLRAQDAPSAQEFLSRIDLGSPARQRAGWVLPAAAAATGLLVLGGAITLTRETSRDSTTAGAPARLEADSRNNAGGGGGGEYTVQKPSLTGPLPAGTVPPADGTKSASTCRPDEIDAELTWTDGGRPVLRLRNVGSRACLAPTSLLLQPTTLVTPRRTPTATLPPATTWAGPAEICNPDTSRPLWAHTGGGIVRVRVNGSGTPVTDAAANCADGIEAGPLRPE